MAGMVQGRRYMDYEIDPDNLPSGVRLLGEGFVGGKAVGLIFAMSAVEFDGERLADRPELLAFPESTIVPTGHFDAFMGDNRLDAAVQAKCDLKITKLEMAKRFMNSPLPPRLVTELGRLLDRERRPLAVRSSSFLEDSIKHSFAGIYQSFFIPNRGTERARLQQLETAVKLVYLSTFGDNAREYRLRHRIAWRTEKMGVLIENLIGREHPDHMYYPLLAGVGFSKNFHPWAPGIDMDGGVVRLVLGLGTRAVGRNYARVFSPRSPAIRPEGGSVEEILKYSQRDVDALDMVTGGMASPSIDSVKLANDRIHLVTSALREGSYFLDPPRRPGPDDELVLTFDPILRPGSAFPLVKTLEGLLDNLQRLMQVPVDMEFAVNIGGDDRLYIVQVRPLGGRPEHRQVNLPRGTPRRNIVLRSQNVLGNGIKKALRHIVYVPLRSYRFDRGFALARQIGEVNAGFEGDGYILIGPGRWATSHPELGVPVAYAEISNAQVIVECSWGSFTPELSYGTHFFGDMVVTNTLYIPVFHEKGDFLNVRYLERQGEALSFEGLRVITDKKGFDVYADGRRRTGMIVRKGGR
ncbi:MAG: hypothetical protein FJ149_11965 [Euryarchaeota archaeon]|nr:hypothetical protein [Euryarchaeota archaeon]